MQVNNIINLINISRNHFLGCHVGINQDINSFKIDKIDIEIDNDKIIISVEKYNHFNYSIYDEKIFHDYNEIITIKNNKVFTIEGKDHEIKKGIVKNYKGVSKIYGFLTILSYCGLVTFDDEELNNKHGIKNNVLYCDHIYEIQKNNLIDYKNFKCLKCNECKKCIKKDNENEEVKPKKFTKYKKFDNSKLMF